MNPCVGIIVAMEEEITYFRDQIDTITITTIGNSELYSGSINGVRVVVMRSGIGKVNATIAATLLIRDFKPQYIINTGSAAGLHEKMKVGDIAVSSRVFHHDFDLTPIGFAYGEVPGFPVLFTADTHLVSLTKKVLQDLPDTSSYTGDIGSGEFFVSDATYVAQTKERFPQVIAIEMEAAAIAQVCVQFNTPFVVIRAISDVADNDSPVSFDAFVKTAGKKSAVILIRLLAVLKADQGQL